MAGLKVRFSEERITKNTVRFQESTEEDPVIGTLYVQKSSLKKLGWQSGQELVLTIEKEEAC
jgi:hypothetical protein